MRHILHFIGFWLVILFMLNCNEEPTPSLYDPNEKAPLPDPVITGVTPDSAFAGIDILSISGQNFSTDPLKVHVYFNGVKGTNITTSETQVQVLLPVVSGDSVRILLRVDGAMSFAEYYPYKIQLATIDYGGINYVSDAYGLACDLQENLYVSFGDMRIVKVAPDQQQVDYLTAADGVDGFYRSMKIGPGGELFTVRTRFFYRAPAGQDTLIRSKRLSKTPNDFDFDQYKNIYYATSNGINKYRTSDEADAEVAPYQNYNLVVIRIFNDYVYVGGKINVTNPNLVQKGIWRNKILSAEGQLDTSELVFDWDKFYKNKGQTAPDILTMTFAADGDLYVGADSTATSDAVTILHPDEEGTYSFDHTEPLFAALLRPPANTLCWGNDQYLYLNNRSTNTAEKRVIRLTMGKLSAPYYGLQ